MDLGSRELERVHLTDARHRYHEVRIRVRDLFDGLLPELLFCKKLLGNADTLFFVLPAPAGVPGVVKPGCHKLDVRNPFFSGKPFYHGDIEWIHTNGNRLGDRPWNFK